MEALRPLLDTVVWYWAGFLPQEIRDQIRASFPSYLPKVVFRPKREMKYGQQRIRGWTIQATFHNKDTYRTLSLSETCEILWEAADRFEWLTDHHLTVNRLDLAFDQITREDPQIAVDRIKLLGQKVGLQRLWNIVDKDKHGKPYDGHYHATSKGKNSPVVVACYSRPKRLDSLSCKVRPLARLLAQGVMRLEVRFHQGGVRGRLDSSAHTTSSAEVFSVISQYVDYAEKQLSRIFEFGILTPNPRDRKGEAAMAELGKKLKSATGDVASDTEGDWAEKLVDRWGKLVKACQATDAPKEVPVRVP